MVRGSRREKSEYIRWQKQKSKVRLSARQMIGGGAGAVSLCAGLLHNCLGSESTVCGTGLDNDDDDSNSCQRLRVECANTGECGVGGGRTYYIILLLSFFLRGTCE